MKKLKSHRLPNEGFWSNYDVWILFLTKGVRLFSYGSLAVPLLMYLQEIGLNEHRIGLLLTLIMVGDLVITMLLSGYADRLGRRNTLAIGAMLKFFTGVIFSISDSFLLLAFSGIIGVISMSGTEVGPFLGVEQAALTDISEKFYQGKQSKIAQIFGWYNLVGYVCQALGALFAGYAITFLKFIGTQQLYAFWGLVKWMLYRELSDDIELSHKQKQKQRCSSFGIKRQSTLKTILTLSFLFSLDSFGGGFTMNSFISYWFVREWSIEESTIGTILMVCSILGAAGGILSSGLVDRFGAMATMLLTHVPSSFLLILIPLMPNKTLTIIVLILRFSTSNMNLSARQTYVATIVQSDERSAANGISNVARSFGLALSPLLLGQMMAAPTYSTMFSMPFYFGGSVKLIYDVLIWLFYVNPSEIRKFTYDQLMENEEINGLNNHSNGFSQSH